MLPALPIVHSIVDAQALSELIARAWALPKPIHCELLTRGMNDVYLLRDGSGVRWACRVWRAGFRSRNDVAYETAFLEFLYENGIPVSPALTAHDGTLFQSVPAVEGQRFCAIFQWVDGTPFGNVVDERRSFLLGKTFGQIHKIAHHFCAPVERYIDTAQKLRSEYRHVERMMTHRLPDQEWYAVAIEALVSALEKLSPNTMPFGPTHGDFHLFNAFFEGEELVLLDFDNCGHDFFLAEINSFFWANHYVGGIAEAINEAFLKGYTAERPLSQAEQANMPLFYAAKEMSFLCGFAANVNYVGHTPLLNPDLDWFAESTRRNIRNAGLI